MMNRLLKRVFGSPNTQPEHGQREGSGRDVLADELRRRRMRADRAVGIPADGPSSSFRSGTDALILRDPLDLTPRPREHESRDASIPEELRRGIDPAVLKLLTPQLAHEFKALPVRIDGSTIVFATAQEPTYKLQNEIRWLVGLSSDRQRRPVFVRVPPELLAHSLDVYYPFSQNQALIPADVDLLQLFAQRETEPSSTSTVLRPGAQAASSVRSLVSGILMKAVYRGANDVLFECFETEFRIRFKVEGECEYAMTPLPPNAAAQVISIVKQHAKLDIAETEKCQDGRFDMKIEYKGEVKSIQFRVAIRPTINGEGCVVRLHDNAERRPRLDNLGADTRTLEALHRVRDHRGGLVLFSGPTGSGKTTTLAAILGECDSVRENIVTIEDPVEIRLPGVTQSTVNEAKGETFARLLRNTLRVAPDRILVGEIRDAETAHLVVKAALTGHQVLSTVHSEDAPKAVTRVLEEGISPFNLASVAFLVVAQRLLNRLCAHCSYDVAYPFEVLDREQFSPAEYGEIRSREAHGCSMCHHRGTFGRIAIYETLVVSDEIRSIIARRPPDMEALVRRAALVSGTRPLRRWGLDLVKEGVVGLAQVADATPYIPADALDIVWKRVATRDTTARSVADRPTQSNAGSVEGLDGPYDGAAEFLGSDLQPIIVRSDLDERARSLAMCPGDSRDSTHDSNVELLRSLVDRAQAEARATIVGRSTGGRRDS